MRQYLVANYLPDDFDPSAVTEAMMEDIHALNREMIAAGVRKFACGISPAGNAKTVRKKPDGTVLVTAAAGTRLRVLRDVCRIALRLLKAAPPPQSPDHAADGHTPVYRWTQCSPDRIAAALRFRLVLPQTCADPQAQ